MTTEMSSFAQLIGVLLILFLSLIYLVVSIALKRHRKKMIKEIRYELILFGNGVFGNQIDYENEELNDERKRKSFYSR